MTQYVYEVGIEGMMCGMCEAHINDKIRSSFKVKSVKSSRFKKKTIIISLEPLDEEKIKEVIKETGYHYIDLKSSTREKKSLFKK